MVQNKALVFKAVPEGWPEKGKHLDVEAREFDLGAPPPKNGITTKIYYASFDPYQRGRMSEPSKKSYASPFTIGQPMTNHVIAKVLKSDNPNFGPGDIVVAFTDIAEFSAIPEQFMPAVKKIENPYNLDLKLWLGPLGMPGITAFSSFYEIGQPKKGETIFISAASGAVGQIVGQLAKHEGLKAIGSVGDDKKLDFITKELAFDGGFNYKKEKPDEALTRLCPEGVDIYYENVGGEHFGAALDHMNTFGRIIVCGMISQYNVKPGEEYAVRNITQVIGKRLKIQGFIQSDANMGPKYAVEHQEKMQKWLQEGTFKAKLSITEGIDNAVDGFIGMLEGKNFGKAILQIADIEKDSV